MGKKNKYRKQAGNQPAVSETEAGLVPGANNVNAYRRTKIILATVIAVLAFALYIQTAGYEYTLDDLSVITKNKVVKQGFSGIPELLKTDYWYGFTEKLRGQQYRPLSLVSFAIEQQFFPLNPQAGHFVNVLLYALTCLLLFLFMCRLVPGNQLLLPFITVLLYTAHPIHTEVVSNIKSRDEILCFLFAIGALISALAYTREGKMPWLLASGLLLLLSIMAKETGIAFLLIIPLTIFIFRKTETKKIVSLTVSLAVFTGIYLFTRYQVVHDMPSIDIAGIDNTLMLATSASENYGTAFSILLRYVGLLLLPVNLSYDYSFAQIPIVGMSDPKALMGFLLYAAMGIFAVMKIRKKNYYAYAILFFLLVLAPVSNLFLKIGSTMAERFLYMPSFGFCFALGLFCTYITGALKKPLPVYTRFFQQYAKTLGLVALVTVLYAFKTFNRNQDWQDNEHLFRTGMNTAENSARAHYNWGTVNLGTLYQETDDPALKREYMNVVQSELERAIQIYPGYINDIDFLNIHAAALMYGQKYDLATRALDTILRMHPTDTTALKNMGKSYAYQSQFAKAATYFERTITQAPAVAENWRLTGMAYQFMGDTVKAKRYLQHADSLSRIQ